MLPFFCSVCGQLLFFDNSTCLGCGSDLGYLPDARELVALRTAADGLERADGTPGFYRHCVNQVIARCNWLVPCDDPAALCASCRLTSVRPNDNETDSLVAFANAEAAKRRLVHQLLSLGLPVIGRSADPVKGVAFELLSSRARTVITGHDSGVITLDLSESDDVHREFVRQQLGEPYRTVLGHLRHEIGHYYWQLLVVDSGNLEAFRALFGDEQISYEASREQHYANGVSGDWSGTHVSEYATMHPWEDWAETFAHYLHIDAGLATATGIGLDVHDPARHAGIAAGAAAEHVTIGPMVQRWLGLTIALNAMARSIGQPDLYPFVLSPKVVEKLDFVHRAIAAHRTPG
jgi:hypothetical protein